MKNGITAALKGCATSFTRRAAVRAAYVAQPFRAALIGGTVAVVVGVAPLVAQDGQWLTYSGSYSSHRHSPLTQITTSNVAKLRPVWAFQPPGTGSLESTPIVANGVMYVTS